ncbi:MAG: ABC transporter ATP-binding protein [Bacteroidota bacterium]
MSIKAINVSKEYILQHEQQAAYRSIREDLSSVIVGLFKRDKTKTIEVFNALSDVSFEINQGERVGIIGRNGAGKSTLLKILSRITEPTSGRIEITGRVASLLEVGTGFHPELSGRENIYLNGAILGMSRIEIQKKFNEIVAFAEVEQFLDTPVKRYSSGMYVRLAFAVAAHLEPEILIVDEVLAVGDSQFQKKCLGKMEDVSRNSKRTVLFVSHNMAAIQHLCDKVIYLEKGKVKAIGKTDEVIKQYLKAAEGKMPTDLSGRTDRSGSGVLRFTSVELLDENHRVLDAMHCGSKVIVSIKIDKKGKTLSNLNVAMGIDDSMGQRITHFSNEVTDQSLDAENDSVNIYIDKVPFKEGRYTYTLFSSINGEIVDYIIDAGSFEVVAGDFYHTGKLPPEGQGSIFVNHSFKN